MPRISLVLFACAVALLAEKKDRDWQSGRVVETSTEQKTIAWGSRLNQKTALVNQEVYSVETADKSYLVSGPVSGRKGVPTAGMTISFAVEGKTMFMLLLGKEHRFYIDRVSAAPNARAFPPSATGASGVSAPRDEPVEQLANELDNDGVVKMNLAELKADTIVEMIKKKPGRYVLTPDAVAGLKAAGLPESVIDAMSAKMNAHKKD